MEANEIKTLQGGLLNLLRYLEREEESADKAIVIAQLDLFLRRLK